jgi:hypothetical protein
MLAMIRPKVSVASNFGSLASLLASSHGSFPNRANTETTLRVMPFASVPTGAKRNSFNPERDRAKASELGILNSYNRNDEIILDIVYHKRRYNCLVSVFAVFDGYPTLSDGPARYRLPPIGAR